MTETNAENGNCLKLQEETKGFEEDDHVEEEEWVAADGGFRAWLVLVASFLCNGVLFGLINSYSVLNEELHQNLVESNVTDASSKAGKCMLLTRICF